MAHVNFSINGRVPERNVQELPQRRSGFLSPAHRRLPPPRPLDPRPGIPGRLDRDHAPYTIEPHPFFADNLRGASSSRRPEDVGYGVAFNVFPLPELEAEAFSRRASVCHRHHHHHASLSDPYLPPALSRTRENSRVAPARSSPPRPLSSWYDHVPDSRREFYDLGLPSPRHPGPCRLRAHPPPANTYQHHQHHHLHHLHHQNHHRSLIDEIDYDDEEWRLLNEVADATYSSPSPVRRLGGRESSSAAYVGEVGGHGQPRRRATPIPDWDEDDLYDDYVEEEEDENDHRGPFFEVEYTPNPDYLPPEPDSPDGSEPQHFFGFNRFGFPVDDYNSDDDGSYGPDSVLDEDEIDLDEDSDLDADGREYYSSDTSGAHNEDATYYDSEEEHEDSLPPEGSLSVDEDQGREVGEQGTSRTRNELEVSREDDEESAVQGSPRARDDPEEEARGDREESVASAASSSEMPGVRKRNAAGAAAAGQNSSTEPASKRRRTATATASTSATTTDTPSRRRAAPPSAEGSEAKKEAKAEDDDKFFSDEEKDEEDEILDLSKEDELPANLLVEKPDNSVRLGKLQCVICMDDATNLMITHCGHLFCSECLHGALYIDPVKRICPICRQKVELGRSAGGRATNPKKTFWPLELKLMTKNRAGKQAAGRR